jgi:hypothetical protein
MIGKVPYEILIPVAFFGALLICHWSLRWPCIRNDEKLWIMVEYVWLLGAVLGLVSAASEVRRMNTQREAQAQRAHLTSEWNQLRTSTRGSLDVGSSVMEGCPGMTKSQPDCPKIRAWFGYAASALELGVENERWRTFLYQNAPVDPIETAKPDGASRVPQFPQWDFEPLPDTLTPMWLETAQVLLVGMRKLDELRAEVLEVEKSANLRWYDFLLRSTVPWFLTIALALRITKNSVQYLKQKEQGNPASPVPPPGSPVQIPEEISSPLNGRLP